MCYEHICCHLCRRSTIGVGSQTFAGRASAQLRCHIRILGRAVCADDRHGYARRSDEIVLFAVAESLPARHVDRYEQFRLSMKTAEGISLYPVLRAYTQEEIDNAGGLETALALTFDDWDKIL